MVNLELTLTCSCLIDSLADILVSRFIVLISLL